MFPNSTQYVNWNSQIVPQKRFKFLMELVCLQAISEVLVFKFYKILVMLALDNQAKDLGFSSNIFQICLVDVLTTVLYLLF